MIRRLHGMAAIDPEIEAVLQARAGRREGLRGLVRRVAERRGHPAPEAFEETVELRWALLNFEMFYALAGPERRSEDVVPQITRLAHAALQA